MIRFLALLLVVLALGAVFAPGFREALGWVLAFLSLLMLGSLVRNSFAKLRQHWCPPPRPCRSCSSVAPGEFNSEVQHSGPFIALRRCPVPEPLPRPLIQLARDPVALRLIHPSHTLPLR